MKAMNQPQKDQVISIQIKDKQALYLSYMPFVKGGGLFLKLKKNFNLGDTILLIVQVMKDEKPYNVKGKVVWITPPGANKDIPRGVGVQFVEGTDKDLHRMIENTLGTSLASNLPTYTM